MRPLSRFPRKLLLLIFVGFLTALIAVVLRLSVLHKVEVARQQALADITTVVAERGDFELYFESQAEMESASTRQISAPIAGQIRSIIPDGAKVKEGDIIAELDAPQLFQELESAIREQEKTQSEKENADNKLNALVEQAKIQLQQREKELENFRAEQEAQLTEKKAQLDRDTHELDLQRNRLEAKKRLADEKLIAGDEITIAEAELKAKEFDLEKQTRELELAEAHRASEAAGKEASVNQAKAYLAQTEATRQSEQQNTEGVLQMLAQQIASLQDQINKASLRAPATGTLIWAKSFSSSSPRPAQLGDGVWEGFYLGDIVDLNQMKAIIQIPQDKARELKVHQKAIITIPALPGVKLSAEIVEIAQTATDERSQLGILTGIKTFRTVLAIDNEKKIPLRPSMGAKVHIILGKVADAVSIPQECVFERDCKQIVYVKRNGKYEPRTVKLGPQNTDEVVIEQGLGGGETVALYDVSEITQEEVSR